MLHHPEIRLRLPRSPWVAAARPYSGSASAGVTHGGCHEATTGDDVPWVAFTFETVERGACCALASAGELDVCTAPVLRQRLVELFASGFSCVIVDIEFIDSTGLGILVGALHGARSQGASLTLAGLSRSSRRLFEITGLDRDFANFESADDSIGDHQH